MWPFVANKFHLSAAQAGPWLIVLILLMGCGNANQYGTQKESTETNPEDTLRQKPQDLLAGTHKAICYSGFRSGQHPDRGNGAKNPSYEETLEDLKIISKDAGFKLIRVYDCGENTEMVLRVIEENKLNIKVLLGIWLKAELSNHETCVWLTEPIPDEVLQENKIRNLEEIERGINLANEYEKIVVAVNVGNEALVEWNDHKVSTDTIISYVQKVKKSIHQEVTVADNYKWWADHGTELARTCDFVSIHVYPVWEGKDIDEGLSYTIENIYEVRAALPDARIVITEAGWPSVASEFPERVSEEKQMHYYKEIMAYARENNITTFIFEAFDEDWKGNPTNMDGAEKHWGLFNIDRTPKKVMKHIYSRNK